MVEETGQRDRMTASNVAGQDIGHEIVHLSEVAEVLAHSLLHVLGMLVLALAETVMQMFVIGIWMINMIEAVLMIEIVMTSGMNAMGPVTDTSMTGTPQLETGFL